ncbi:MAG: TonB-dependent receptor [Verrucomicrobia bacterium]|nr:TonB-dependent receptor [Verrucomicrobiota bacterium]
MLLRRLLALALALTLPALTTALPAQPAATGTIEGRVQNARTGEFLERARLTIAGSSLEAFTAADGSFRLAPVPAGDVTLQIFYTGLPAESVRLPVAAGATVTRDIELGPKAPAAGDTVKLAAFVVGESREMAASALAINEQRFAPNIKNVLSTDEFVTVAEGNAAEFLKFIPGVTVESTGGNARDISINGAPAANVPITLAGFSVASANVGDTNVGRTVAMDMMSVNNLSRIEVEYTPTPESQGAALSGTVNLVPRSAFERARPVFNFSTYLSLRSNENSFSRSAGPRRTPSRKAGPGVDFSWVAPLSRRFGFTLAAGTSGNFSPEIFTQMLWRPASGPTGGNFPASTPDRPYLTTYNYRDAAKDQQRGSASATLDYRLGAHDRLSLGFQYSYFNLYATNQTLGFVINRVPAGGFSPTSTHSGPANGDAELQLTNLLRDRYNRTYMPSLTWRHDGPVWKADAGFAYSKSTNANRDIDKGGFNATTGFRRNVTIVFDQVQEIRPGTITVIDIATGRVIDPFAIDGKTFNTATAAQNDTDDQQRTAYANLARDFFGRVPVKLKAGLHARQSIRDNRGFTSGYTYLGPDLNAATDESAAPFLDPVYANRSGAFGFPAINGLSNYLAWERAKASPEQFTVNRNNEYRSLVQNSKYARELVSAAYARGDVALFDRRLKLTGGLRAEQTNISARGPRTDPTLNFQRDAAGRLLGTPTSRVLIRPASDALGVSQLTFLERGTHVTREYLRLFPNLNASYQIRDNLVVRAAGFTSIGRPDFNQFAGGVSLPDPDANEATSFITVNNAGLKPWRARTLNVRIEYYFAGVGQLSLNAFRRDTRDFFGGQTIATTPEFLDLYDLDPAAYGKFRVQTQVNVPGTVRMEGSSLNYKQALTFLPAWARGVQVFFNASSQRRTGALVGNSGFNFYPRSASWGASLTRPRYNLRLNWNHRGERRGAAVTGAGIPADNYTWIPKQTTLDAQAEWNLLRRYTLFASLRNATAVPTDTFIYNDATPALARFRNRIDYGALWTFGVKGTF